MRASLLVTGFLTCAIASPLSAQPSIEKPWRLRDAIEAPEWLSFGIAHRSRFEPLRNDFRGTDAVDPMALFMRTLVAVEAAGESAYAGLELQDSRGYASDETTVNTSMVNPLDLLQAYVGLRRSALFSGSDAAELRLGRITLDLGSRRLVARNRYRNTINGFTGIDASWTASEHIARAFVVVPVTRQPGDAMELDENDFALDQENTDTLLWAGYYRSPMLIAGARIEGMVLGLHERDGDLESRDRQLVTPGLRIWREPAGGELDFQIEAAVQVGSSRASTAADDTEDLDHRALLARAEAGATIDAPWTPRIAGQLDYASGDRDPADGENGRFDPLFGARRFDFGPTSIYGPIARSNIVSPGLRVIADPIEKTLDAFVAYRLFWLASATDAWTTTGLRDPAGASGRFVGQQVEARVRWHLLPRNVDLELGAAHFIRGGFARSAGGTGAPSTYVYTSVTGTI